MVETAKIHPTAIVDPQAQLGENVSIGPYAIIKGPVKVGDNTEIQAHVYITGDTTIGQNCQIFVGSVIGTEPQDIKFDSEIPTGVIIGDDNVIREYVTVHRASAEGEFTEIGDRNFIMAQSHFAHDCKIGNEITVANNAMVGGHVEINDNAYISGGVPIHQFVRVGQFALLSGWSAVSMDVPPFMIANGPNQVRAINVVGLNRAGFPRESLSVLRTAFKILYRSEMTISEAIEELEKEEEDKSGHLQTLIDFIRSSKRGICKAP